MQCDRKKQREHHLQSEDARDGFMVTDAVLHVAGVSVLHYTERKSIQRLLRLLLLFITISILRWRCGVQPPQDPIAPRRLPLFPAAQSGEYREEKRREECEM